MLFHICPAADWDATAAEYEPPRYRIDGFIHLSTIAQVTGPANRLFAGRDDLFLLCIAEAKLGAEVRWEASAIPEDHGEEFPHLYGPLNTDAVVDRIRFPPNSDGRFDVPAALVEGDADR